ncbi:MAG: WD40 repeat domain-containing protein [Lewinellaceae bacterium]|nr:WD40 repeat domain-containing protein [Lewinellaceae bacterium]
MKSILFSFVLLACFSATLDAQGRYDFYFNKGKTAFEAQDFKKAIDAFEAAKICSDATAPKIEKADQWLKDAQEKYITAIEDEKRKAEEALAVAEKAKEAAERSSRISEASRRAFLANQELEQEKGADALQLAYSAFQLIGEGTTPSVIKAFGDAVFSVYSRPFADGKDLRSLLFSSDGNYILGRSGNNAALIWDVAQLQQKVLSGHSGYVLSACFSPNGLSVLTTSADHTAKLWDLKGTLLATCTGHLDAVTGGTFSPDSKLLLTWSRDGSAKLWDHQGKELGTFSGHDAPVLEALFTLDGSTVLTRGADHKVCIWGTGVFDKPKAEVTHNGHIYFVSLSQSGDRFLTGGADQVARVWDLKGTLIATLKGHTGPVHIGSFSRDGKSLLTASTDGTVKWWDAEGNLLRTLNAHQNWITSASFSPDGNTVLSASKRGRVAIWQQDDQVFIMEKHSQEVTSACFSPDGKEIMTTSKDGTAKLWDLQGNVLMNQQDRSGEKNASPESVFSPDGQLVLTFWPGSRAILCPIPNVVYQKLKMDPPPPFSPAQKVRFEILE